MCMFLGLKKIAIVFEDEHQLQPSLVHMYSCLYLFQRSLNYKYIWNQSVLSHVPWFLQAQLRQLGGALRMRINFIHET